MEQQQFGEPREEGLFEESINLRHYWHIVLERRWLVVATFAVVMVLCLFYLFTVTSIFSATTRLQIDNETENSMRMESFVMEGNQGQDYLQTQYKNLQSRSLMKTVLLETQQNAKILESINSGRRTLSQLGELDGLATGQVEQRLQQMAIAGFFGPTKDTRAAMPLPWPERRISPLFRASLSFRKKRKKTRMSPLFLPAMSHCSAGFQVACRFPRSVSAGWWT